MRPLTSLALLPTLQEYAYYQDSIRNYTKQIGDWAGAEAYPGNNQCEVCCWAGTGTKVLVDGEEHEPPELQVLADFCQKLGHFIKCSMLLRLPHPNQRHYITQEAALQALPENMRAAAEALGRTAAAPASDEHATCSDHRAATESGRQSQQVCRLVVTCWLFS